MTTEIDERTHLASCLDGLQEALESLEEMQDCDLQISKWHDQITKIYQDIEDRYSK